MTFEVTPFLGIPNLILKVFLLEAGLSNFLLIVMSRSDEQREESSLLSHRLTFSELCSMRVIFLRFLMIKTPSLVSCFGVYSVGEISSVKALILLVMSFKLVTNPSSFMNFFLAYFLTVEGDISTMPFSVGLSCELC